MYNTEKISVYFQSFFFLARGNFKCFRLQINEMSSRRSSFEIVENNGQSSKHAVR